MTLCIIVRTVEGIAIATDTATTSTARQVVDNSEVEITYHTYYRRKLVASGRFAIVHTGTAFINGKTVSQIIECACSAGTDIQELDSLENTLKAAFMSELESDSGLPKIPVGQRIVALGIVGYHNGVPLTKSLYFDKGADNTIDIIENVLSDIGPKGYGISYYGDFEFAQLVIQAAIDRNLMKPFEILTLKEALDLARTLLHFVIDFQKFMIRSTVDYPIESVVITHSGGLKWIDQMSLETR